MLNIVIVGAGQIGSRHLQALALLALPANIRVIDPSAKSLAVARERWLQAAEGSDRHYIAFAQTMTELPAEIDVAIIATSANVRRAALEALLTRSSVRYAVLEKVLFQSIRDLDEIQDQLGRSQTKVWVNCPRRMWNFYRDVRAMMARSRLFSVSVEGSSWGLCCNTVHFLDLVAWITDSTDVAVSGDGLDPETIDSKRSGFIEMTGELTGGWRDGPSLRISSWAIGDSPFLLQLRGEDAIVIVREDEGRAWISERSSSWQWSERTLVQERQSQLSHLFVESLAEAGVCDLTPYDDSAALHRSMLKPMLAHLSRLSDRAGDTCPIT